MLARASLAAVARPGGAYDVRGVTHAGAERTLTMPRRVLQARWLRPVIGALGYTGAITATVLAAQHVDTGFAIATLLPAYGLVTAGLIGWRARPAIPLGPLMTAAGMLFCLWPTQAFVSVPVLTTASMIFGDLSSGFVVHFLLAFPSGRLPDRLSKVATVAVYLLVLPFPAARTLGSDPADEGCPGCDQAENLLFLSPSEPYYDALAIAELPLILSLSGLVAWVLVRRWRAATEPRRLVLRPVFLSGVGAALVAFVRETADGIYARGGGDLAGIYYTPDAPPVVAATALYGVAGCLVGFGYLAGLLRTRVTRSTIADLVVTAGSTADSARLREPLARALGDPTLEVGFWVPSAGRYVTADGRPFVLPGEGTDRTVTIVHGEVGPLAALVHDPAVLDDEGLIDAVTAAARLALERARLQAELRAQLEAVRESRARLVHAGDEERRKIERDIHDGAQQRLVSVGLALRHVQSELPASSGPADQLAAAVAQLSEAIQELRELARGVRPAALDDGLAPALRQLASRSPLRTLVEATDERFEGSIETAAYFVASEALANAAKHAHATQVTVKAARRNGSLVVCVKDDGVGGAAAADGSGLTGMTDRVAALGGSLRIDSPPGGGTAVTAELPCGS